MTSYYRIPTNYTDAGRILGMFPLRNLIETMLLVLPVTVLAIQYIHLPISPKIVVILTVIIPLGGFGLMGIGGDSLGQWVGGWWRWRQKRQQLFFRGMVKK
ncbi:hypothetical protein RFF05_14250 [Bengtsoniella intestinalis]|uniref:hypothetical protein n=1 Tax=Bengtsoniella intestinalis TaxID=3073143 RepID=UPI00391F9A41